MNRYAILIGNSRYPIEAGLQDLRCPENDVDGMAEILGNANWGNFYEPLKLKNCTTGQIKREMGKVFSLSGKNDLVLVYYSGHGKQDLEGQLYLATSDTYAIEPLDLVSTALSVSDIRNLIRQSKSNKVIIILDCCYSGAIGNNVLRGSDPTVVLANLDEGRGTYILTASTSLQTAQEKEEDQFGLLTKYIINGIKTGDADRDNDGSISMDDLYDYVFEMVRKDSPQTPMKWSLNIQGKEIAIARVFKEIDQVPSQTPDDLFPKMELEKLEPPGGVVRLGSPFYVTRKTDELFLAAIRRKDTIVLVKGARQMGKTSLLARGLQQAKQLGAKVAVTDFQALGYAELKTLKGFYKALVNSLSDRLNINFVPDGIWNERRGDTLNFGIYIRKLLDQVNSPIVWGMDEVDRLFTLDYGSEVFGLFRSWFNDCQLDPDSPWNNLTMAISYATEASLFIRDLHQSPFNVGTRLTLSDFNIEEVSKLNTKHSNPLRNLIQLNSFFNLLGGHPFLVRSGLYVMVTEGLNFSQFETIADKEDGPFGDHLRRFIEVLDKDRELEDEVKEILRGKPCSTESFYRLRSAGLMAGESAHDVRPRCKLYEMYLKRHLL